MEVVIGISAATPLVFNLTLYPPLLQKHRNLISQEAKSDSVICVQVGAKRGSILGHPGGSDVSKLP